MNRLRMTASIVALIVIGSGFPLLAQGTKPAPPPKKAPAKPVPPKPVAVPPAPAPAPPPPADVRFKTTYTTGDQVTDSTTFIQGPRERYELGDIILIKQRDQKRTIQISRASNTYLVTADADAAVASAPADPPRPPGVVIVNISVVDLGERKDAFGRTARRVRTVIDRQPQPGACDQSKLLIETDGWYIDQPKALATPVDTGAPATGTPGCQDEIKTTENGEPTLLGFPVGYRSTFTAADDKDAKPMVVAMEVTEFEVLKLDGALFDPPAGMTAAANMAEYAKSVGDANEAKLAKATPASDVYPAKKPGTLRVGVPEVANKTTTTVDTRALRARFIAELENQKIEAIPMTAAPPAELAARAIELGVDYLLVAEINDLKVSKPGGLTRMMKVTAGDAATKDITEAKVNVQLLAPGSKPRLSKSANGKDGGVGFKTGLGVAKFAGSIYLKMYMGGMYGGQMNAFSSFGMMNMGGAGGSLGMGGSGVDRTATAASYIMQQVMANAAAGGGADGGPSFDAALGDAIEDASKDVVESIKKATPAKK